MDEYLKRSDVENWLKDICEATESDTDYVLSRLDEIEKADVQKVRHAKYGEGFEFIPFISRICSSCGDIAPQGNYCVTCGARMDGGT